MPMTKQRITDKDELDEYRMSKRKAFEDEIRRQRHHLGTWIKYALWEESQLEFKRARSIFERAIDVDYKSQTLWLKYAEMEMKHKFINHARNVWDRAVTLLPRVPQFWYKYAFMEEMVGNVAAARHVFERWMKWQPEDSAWFSYIKLETRVGEIQRARDIYERYLLCHPCERAYIKYAKWELRQQQPALSRQVYERAIEELRDDEKTQELYIAFAAFEEKMQEPERARAIFQHALNQIPKEDAQDLYNAFVKFEKQHGDKRDVDDVIVAKRRIQYEQQVQDNPMNYDTWFDYIRLEEAEREREVDDEQVEAASERVREIYERAIAKVPPTSEKQHWVRYIYLWINYALYEELVEDETERTRQVYRNCLSVIPHKHFTFAKIWLLAAQFEVRQRNVQAARKLLGQAIGRCPKHKLFKSYIHLELQMGQVERCRTLYEKYLEFQPQNCRGWVNFSKLETSVGEIERSRAIYELAINQSSLDMPELLWKSFIDFEIEVEELGRAQKLYERLLERTKHVKVWISYAKFLSQQAKEIEEARDVYSRAYDYFKQAELKDERYMLLEAWKSFEVSLGSGNSKHIANVNKRMPRKLNKKRMTYAEDGVTELGFEEFVDYVFPDDDDKAKTNFKLLDAARLWKQKRAREEETKS